MRWIVVFALVLMAALPAQADTPTPSPTPVPTSTPDFARFWSLPVLNAEGTPEAQDVEFTYRVEAGNVSVALLAGALLFSLWGMFTIWLLLERKQK